MIAYNELATLYGMPHGAYFAVHPVADHSSAGFGFSFVDGRTGVIDGKTCARIFHGVHGVVFEPADDETRRAVVEHVRNYLSATRADELAALFFPAPAPATEPPPESATEAAAPAEESAPEGEPVAKKGKTK